MALRDNNGLIANIGGGSGGGINYSLEEQDTGLKWVDGKKIYQKSGYIASSGNSETILDTTLTSNYIDSVIFVRGTATYSGTNNKIQLGDFSSTNPRASLGVFDKGLVKLGNGISVTNLYWTIQYTKTTD